MNRTDRLRNLMRAAWGIARDGARRYGGKARQYIAQAMREAWKALRKATWFAGEDGAWITRVTSIGPVAAWTHWLSNLAANVIALIVTLISMIAPLSVAGSRLSPLRSNSKGSRKPWRTGSSQSRWTSLRGYG